MSWKQEIAQLLAKAKLTHAEAGALLDMRAGTISDWTRGVVTPHRKTMERARKVLGAAADPISHPIGVDAQANTPPLTQPKGFPAAPGVLPLAIPQDFATESERISFARGVLLMGAETNRITSESSHQVARAIQAAMAALLAPVTPIAPAFPDSEETRRQRAAAAAVSDASPPGAVAARAPRPARRKAR